MYDIINDKDLQSPVSKCSTLDYINKQTESHPILKVMKLQLTGTSTFIGKQKKPSLEEVLETAAHLESKLLQLIVNVTENP